MQHVWGCSYRHVIRKFCSVKCSPHSLTSKHAEFLDLVRDHGGGSITLTRDTTNSAIAVLTLCNEMKKNAISGQMMAELADILDTLLLSEKIISPSSSSSTVTTKNSSDSDSSDDLVGLIIRGQGRVFCAGADLSLVRDRVNTSERGLMMSRFMTDALTRLRQSRYITVALLTGPAVGGGAEICTVADYRIMVQEETSGKGKGEEGGKEEGDSNHVCFIHASLGASPGWGGAYRLQSIVGRSVALRLLGTSVKVKPEQALAMGLIDHVVVVTPQSTSDTTTASAAATTTAAADAFIKVHSSSPVPSSSSSPPPNVPSSSSSSSSSSSPSSSIAAAGMSAAINFLLPFTQQAYPAAVGDIKQVAKPACHYPYNLIIKYPN